MSTVELRGKILHPDGWSEGSILIRNGSILDHTDGRSVSLGGDIVHEGLILPGLVDMHAHLGDHGARGDLPASLEDAVFPQGVKHRFLHEASTEQLIASISASIKEVHYGTTFVLDFREGGIKGLDALGSADRGPRPLICPLARVHPEEDPEEVLDLSCGIGQPSLDKGSGPLREIARSVGKLYSIHASESFREDIGLIMELEPDLLVHMNSGSRDDWKVLSDEGIPVVVCNRSNRAFDLPTPMDEMLAEGLKMVLGTDNSMSVRQDMFREMESGWMHLRKSGMGGKEASRLVFEMAVGATLEGTKVWDKLPHWTKWWEKGWPRKGDPAHLFAIHEPAGDLWGRDIYSQIVRFSGRSSVLFTGPYN